MRIIFLNIWQGKNKYALKEFLDKESTITDCFCFQEVSPNFLNDLKLWLPGYSCFYEKGRIAVFDGLIYGQAIFLKAEIETDEAGKTKLYNQLGDDIGFLQYQSLHSDNKKLWLGNVHGKTKPGNKKDTKSRLKQSERIINFFKDKAGPIIFGGDFNLLPDTRSVKMFEDSGYRNLIKEFKIKSTRNELSWKQFENDPGFVKQYFADYVFVSPEVKVRSFEVPNIEVSDHLPLILEFEI